MSYPRRIELELTLRCNMSCPTCNRHCNVYDKFADSDMAMDQICRLGDEVKTQGESWDILAVMGGEPTLHPDYPEIVTGLSSWVRAKLVRDLQIWTNGLVAPSIAHVPLRWLAPDEVSKPDGYAHIIIADHSRKIHSQMFLAPKDTGQVRAKCTLRDRCGIALNKYGYWPCGPGGAIARLMGWSQYRKTELPHDSGDWGDLEPLCEMCQYGAATAIPLCACWGQQPRQEVSPTFAKAIADYKPYSEVW